MMNDDRIRAALDDLQGHRPDDAVVARAEQYMLDVFDGLDDATSAGTDEESGGDAGLRPHGAAEIISIAYGEGVADGDGERRRRAWLPIVAAAAALILIAVASSAVRPGGLDGRDGSLLEVVSPVDPAATPTSAETDSPDLGSGGSTGVADRVLPMLVHGRFHADELGVGISFRALEPIWLVRAEPGLLVFATDADDTRAELLEIVRPGSPVGAVQNSSLDEALRAGANADEFTGIVQSTTLDGVASIYWRGSVDERHAAAEGCESGKVCVPLYDSPVEFGLRSGRVIDLIERPTTGATTLLVHSAPSYRGLEPFAGPYRSVIESIRFDDNATGSPTG